MAKININFNGSTYQVDESSLSSATSALRQHLSATMSGSGATVELGGTTYNVDSAKLTAAKNAFVSHLGTIAGEGTTVNVGGTEYSIDSTKLQNAISDITAVLANVGEEVLEGDGQEYYTMAPTALSFRSSASLSELQSVQVNGETVDPSNYTLEEGSTIVTLSIDYLKTLDTGDYEIAIVSDSQTAKGNFTVAAPELNECGFYYNQPYSAYVGALGGTSVFFFREDGTMDFIVIDTNYTEVATFTCGSNAVVVSAAGGTFNGTVSADGTEMYCAELATNFVLGNETIAADEDYLYIYKEDLGGYEVTAIDKTKAEYGAIKTGINGYDTVALMRTFMDSINLVVSPEIPDSVTSIGLNAFLHCSNLTDVAIPSGISNIGNQAFMGCKNLTNLIFEGTVEQWMTITFGTQWRNGVPATHVQCSDGRVAL